MKRLVLCGLLVFLGFQAWAGNPYNPISSTGGTGGDGEPALGNPAGDGYLLKSTAAGVRSWSNSLTAVTFGGFTASRAIVSDGSGNLDVATTTSTEIGYLAGAAAKVPGKITECAVISAPTTADDLPIFKAPYALTIQASSIHVYAIGGTSVVGGLDECTGTAGVCSSVTAVDADITGTAGSDVADDGSLTNPTIASGAWVMWHTTSVTGTVTSVSVCFTHTRD